MVRFLIFQATRPAEPAGWVSGSGRGARGRDLGREQGLLFCSAGAFERAASVQTEEEEEQFIRDLPEKWSLSGLLSVTASLRVSFHPDGL